MQESRRSRRSHAVVGIALAAGLALPAQAIAQEGGSPVTVSVDAQVLSRYLFAGLPFSTGWVGQGHVAVGYSGFTVNLFTNYDFDTEEFNERDIWADYFHMLGDYVGAYIGVGLYNFKNVETVGEYSLTPELYGGLTIYTTLNPSIYIAKDFDLGDGAHGYVSLSHGIPLGSATVTATGRLAYNADYWREGSGFSYADLNISAGLPAGIFTLTPSVAFVGALDEDDFPDIVVWGVNLRADF